MQQEYPGYRASFSISHSIRSNNFSLQYFRHSTGESTGMGSVSDIDNAGLGYSRTFKKRISLNVNLSAYRGKAVWTTLTIPGATMGRRRSPSC